MQEQITRSPLLSERQKGLTTSHLCTQLDPFAAKSMACIDDWLCDGFRLEANRVIHYSVLSMMFHLALMFNYR